MTRAVEDFTAVGSRIRGCVLGGAIGDALGNPIEFYALDRIRQLYGPDGLVELECVDGAALITDDTQMTLFGIEGLIRAMTRINGQGTGSVEAVVRSAYQRWLDTQSEGTAVAGAHANGWLREQQWLYHLRAPGNACLSGLRHAGDGIEKFDQWGAPGPINAKSKGCGSVMRAAPFGLAARSAREAFELAARCALYTHGHPTGYLAAGAFAAMVHQLTLGASVREAVAEATELTRAYPSHEETTTALGNAVALAGVGDPSGEKVETLGGGWIAEEALAIAVYCALVELPESPVRGSGFGTYAGRSPVQNALLLSVNHSGDSDSTGAICGNLLGAAYGYESLPGEWLILVEHRAVITELADDLALALREGHTLALGSRAWTAKYPGD
ncbi:ADP-ribosylglycohydrolase family protein [Stackebrandtia nassauensis]|uniref:ADP-ribosylation/Crystallin J1 n=1 Tax=Stackebrandtia nassauensis (strain DSM 44728 / CIP 108903 / NRRL B-16338 / NBRC 102104 / LLR-40K-21) TaxID=446470 RepID=D3Q2Q7_STANL|nr:ADP-ribosylglycohydrolase family protein [Stackebrandtia nassauensis]ADD45808.1 ADP-ribosylation/Crystallin J1 [Stackebrandtia nassauensis DSM 44728]